MKVVVIETEMRGRPRKYPTPDDRFAAIAKRAREKRSEESQEARAKRLRRMSEYNRLRRLAETDMERKERLQRMSLQARLRRAAESPEEKQERLEKMAESARRRRSMLLQKSHAEPPTASSNQVVVHVDLPTMVMDNNWGNRMIQQSYRTPDVPVAVESYANENHDNNRDVSAVAEKLSVPIADLIHIKLEEDY